MRQALSRGNLDINEQNGACPPVLHTAAGYASPAVVEILLDEGAVLSSNTGGCTALHVSACLGKLANICLLLSRGAAIEAVDASGKTPLFTATTNGQVRAVEVLAAKGANVNHRTLIGVTPMHCAVKQNRLDMVRVLLGAKADITLRFSDLTAVELAFVLDHLVIAEELTRFGNLDDHLGRIIYKNEDALKQAAYADMPRAIEMVYDKGARDTAGEALCLAISERHGKCVQVLLECTATESCVREYINKARLDGLGWLSHSLHGRRPSVKVVRLLVDAGVDTTSTIGVQWGTEPPFESTPTECLVMALEADSAEPVVGEAHLGALKGILRLLRQVPAVHATSWLWPKGVKKSAPVAGRLPLVKRGVTRRHVLLGALAR